MYSWKSKTNLQVDQVSILGLPTITRCKFPQIPIIFIQLTTYTNKLVTSKYQSNPTDNNPPFQIRDANSLHEQTVTV